jgi:hypothetical protein
MIFKRIIMIFIDYILVNNNNWEIQFKVIPNAKNR